MGQSNWRQRLGRVPVLGNLLAGMRGVYSLRTWRAELRDDVDALRRDLQALGAQLDSREQAIDARQLASMQAFIDRQAQVDDAARARQEAWARDWEAGQAALQSRLAQQLQTGDALMADLQHCLTQSRAALRQARRGQTVPPIDPQTTLPWVPAADWAQAMADDPDAGVWRSLVPDAAGAGILMLPDTTPRTWATALQALPAGSVHRIVAPAGADQLDAAGLQSLAIAIESALVPGGQCAIRLDNPENALVAAALCAAGPAICPWTPASLTKVLVAAGFAHVDILRLDAATTPALPGDGPGIAAMNRLLAGPTRFIAVARRGG